MEIDRTRILIGAFLLLAVGAMGFFAFRFFSGAPRVYPTEGIVLFQGKPAVGARITLVADKNTAGRFLPMGVVGEDGTFRLTTFRPDDGAPAGHYRVSIVRSRLNGDELAELKKTRTPEEVEEILNQKATDPLYSKYAEATLQADIPAPGNRLRFELD